MWVQQHCPQISANIKPSERGGQGQESVSRASPKGKEERISEVRSRHSWLISHFIWHFYEPLQPGWPQSSLQRKLQCPVFFLPPSTHLFDSPSVSAFQNVAISFAPVSGFAFRHVFIPPIKFPHAAATRTLAEIRLNTIYHVSYKSKTNRIKWVTQKYTNAMLLKVSVQFQLSVSFFFSQCLNLIWCCGQRWVTLRWFFFFRAKAIFYFTINRKNCSLYCFESGLPFAAWTHLLHFTKKLSMCPFYCSILFYLFRLQNDKTKKKTRNTYLPNTKQTSPGVVR